MIPKKIHLIWLGGEVPGKFQVLVDRIKSINSDYEVKEWNDSNIDFELINQNLFNETQNSFKRKYRFYRYFSFSFHNLCFIKKKN
jgi:mannosyltransferase OCH1-like enzyme